MAGEGLVMRSIHDMLKARDQSLPLEEGHKRGSNPADPSINKSISCDELAKIQRKMDQYSSELQ